MSKGITYTDSCRTEKSNLVNTPFTMSVNSRIRNYITTSRGNAPIQFYDDFNLSPGHDFFTDPRHFKISNTGYHQRNTLSNRLNRKKDIKCANYLIVS